MTTTDWVLDITLILVVLRQVREARLSLHLVLIPLAMVSWAAVTYLHSLPTAGHDLLLIGAFTGTGALLGLLSGAATHVRAQDGHAYVRAGFAAAALWVLGVGTRLAFQLFATYGGDDSIARFSVAHAITTETAWVDALVLMALTEVVVRFAVIFARGHRVVRVAGQPTANRVLVAA